MTVYIIIAIILLFLSFRLYVLNKKESNKLAVYFFWGLLTSGIGQVISLSVAMCYFPLQNGSFLYWGDIIGRLFLYLSAAFLIQMSLYLYFPESKKRLYISYLYVLCGLLLFTYSATLNYQPYFDSIGILHWQAPLNFSIIYGLPLFFAWASITILFLAEFVKSRFKSSKALVIGIGFLLATISGVAQDFGKTILEYLLINLLLALGFILVFFGVFIKEKNRESLNIKKTV